MPAAAARLTDVVVLPTPPFWLATKSFRTTLSTRARRPRPPAGGATKDPVPSPGSRWGAWAATTNIGRGFGRGWGAFPAAPPAECSARTTNTYDTNRPEAVQRRGAAGKRRRIRAAVGVRGRAGGRDRSFRPRATAAARGRSGPRAAGPGRTRPAPRA